MSKKLFYYGSTASFADLYSVRFDGVNEYCRRDLPAAQKLSAISISFWVKKDALNLNFQSCISMQPRGAGGTGLGILIYFNSSSRIVFGKGTGAGNINATGTTYIDHTSYWYHIVCTFDTTNGSTVYLNGVSEATNGNLTAISWTDSGAGYPTPAQLYFGAIKSNALGKGATVASDWFLQGKLDEISIWNKRLTLAEAQEIYNSGNPANLNSHSAAANLISWYRPTVSTYPTITDVKNGYDVTMTNQEAGDIQNDVP